MANTTRQIKSRITASQNISKITKAMEMVAASKMKKAQDQAVAARPYVHALFNSLKTISQNTSAAHPLLTTHENGLDILLIVSTNKGLCGSLNTNLLKGLLAWIELHPEGQVIAVGKKAVTFSRLVGVPIYAQFTELPEKMSFRDTLPISTLVQDAFLQETFRRVDVLYMDFINTLSQHVRRLSLLPIADPDNLESPDEAVSVPTLHTDYLFEPSPAALLNELLPYYIEMTIYQALLEGKASEHSARMVAMKNASENAGELVSELKLLFNKSRQANITSELLDITTASMTIT